MPELPEVETIKRVIEPQIKGLVIEQITVSVLKWLHTPPPMNFAADLKGRPLKV